MKLVGAFLDAHDPSLTRALRAASRSGVTEPVAPLTL